MLCFVCQLARLRDSFRAAPTKTLYWRSFNRKVQKKFWAGASVARILILKTLAFTSGHLPLPGGIVVTRL